jgi:hypothetical protein
MIDKMTLKKGDKATLIDALSKPIDNKLLSIVLITDLCELAIISPYESDGFITVKGELHDSSSIKDEGEISGLGHIGTIIGTKKGNMLFPVSIGLALGSYNPIFYGFVIDRK